MSTPTDSRIIRRLARWGWLGLIGTSLLLLGNSHVSAQSATTTTNPCILLVVEGIVEVARGGTTNWAPAKAHQVIQVGDLVRTGPRSRAAIRLSDLGVLRLDELTTVAPAPSETDAVLLKRGTQYFFNRGKPGSFRFKTALTSGSIRGTEFVLTVDDSGRTVLSMLDGEVETQSNGQILRVQTGEQAVFAPDRAPVKTPLIQAVNVIQWSLYYPGILAPGDLPWPGDPPVAWRASLQAYRKGNLAEALAQCPSLASPESPPERLYLAALVLSVGRVDECEQLLRSLSEPDASRHSAVRVAGALRQMIAVVKHQQSNTDVVPQSATEWMVRSYGEQSQSRLPAALNAAQQAAKLAPDFGFAWARVAELEFGFGRVGAASAALQQALDRAPQNAQAIALQGYLWAAKNQIHRAQEAFEAAMACDGALANAWLGRGLCRIRQGKISDGRQDLQVAATLEPTRALLRSYLGKAFSQDAQLNLARKEISRAQTLDPNDPTAWLYSALIAQQENRLNEGIRDLEHSRELNDNRSLFRSRLLLDQDRAVRGANLASLYQDAGLTDVSVREAARAVQRDYANASAHLFLANSYDRLRDPRQINLRYETPWLNELFLAHLLAPVGAGSLSQYVSQQEYSRLLEHDGVGLSSSTEYRSNGDWYEMASQYGTLGNVSYALDLDYRNENGQRFNDDLRAATVYAKIKAQLTPQDSVLLMANTYDFKSGDVRQYAAPADASPTLRVTEKQEPNLFLGYHRTWSPRSHSLLLLGWLNDRITVEEPNASALILTQAKNETVTSAAGFPNNLFPAPWDLSYSRKLEAYSAELQQIWAGARHTWIGGGRYQAGWPTASGMLTRGFDAPPPIFYNPPFSGKEVVNLRRASVYAYDFWQVWDALQVQAGLSYDYLDYPVNLESVPFIDEQDTVTQWSPKAGFVWTMQTNTHLFGAWTRSLGGVYYDASVRLEPIQIAGFTQTYRSLIPESAPGAVAGLIPGAKFETWGLGLDHRFPTHTYVGLEAEWLNEDARRTVGVFDYYVGLNATPSSTRQRLDYEERALSASIHQLLGRDWSLGAQYRFSLAQLETRYPAIPLAAQARSQLDFDSDTQAALHHLMVYVNWNHPCGFFSRLESLWFQQDNDGYVPQRGGDDFWQCNLYAGYRFPRRAAEVTVGILNLTGQDYRLNPLSLYPNLMRDRTLMCRVQFNF
jgi:Tfp pilus assembly protein PilF